MLRTQSQGALADLFSLPIIIWIYIFLTEYFALLHLFDSLQMGSIRQRARHAAPLSPPPPPLPPRVVALRRTARHGALPAATPLSRYALYARRFARVGSCRLAVAVVAGGTRLGGTPCHRTGLHGGLARPARRVRYAALRHEECEHFVGWEQPCCAL